MKRIIVARYDQYMEYTDDIKRIVQAMRQIDVYCTKFQAKDLWREYSESMAAGWLGLPATDKEIIDCVSPYFEEIEDDYDI